MFFLTESISTMALLVQRNLVLVTRTHLITILRSDFWKGCRSQRPLA